MRWEMDKNELMEKCRKAVHDWDQNTLLDYAITSLFTYYIDNPEEIVIFFDEEST